MGKIIVDDKFEVRGVYTCPTCNKMVLGINSVWNIVSPVCMGCGWDKTGGVLVNSPVVFDGGNSHREYVRSLFNMWNESVSKYTGENMKKSKDI